MTAEERAKKLHDLNEQSIKMRNEIRELEKEKRYEEQQESLQWVGRAFKTEKSAVLVTSVPPVQQSMTHDIFNRYQFPCIKISLEGYMPPTFDETVYINSAPFYNNPLLPHIEYEEISFKEFQEILEQRISDILKLAATAKMRQQGKEVFSLRDGEICEK